MTSHETIVQVNAVVGFSMGAMISQLVALDHPDRVLSLTLMSTSPGPGDPDLPPSADELRAHFARPEAVPAWSDREAVVDYIVESEGPYAATSRPFDEAAWRELARRLVDRTVNIEAEIRGARLLALERTGHELPRAVWDVVVPAIVEHTGG
jgi:pimeloyl-ACP methyl ester carboxylesterase